MKSKSVGCCANFALRWVVLAVLVGVGAPPGTRAAEAAPVLTPGASLTVRFPEMPPTFYAVAQKREAPAQMTIFLPLDYEPGREFPLLVFLGGGDGGAGGNPGVARSLCQGRGFICVSLPLFKAADPQTKQPAVSGPGFIMGPEDGKYMWPLFKTMVDKVDAVVPNIDPTHRVLGGFSNGAHATVALIDASEGEVTRRFSAFLLVEGGGKLQHYDRLKNKPFLMVSSNAKSKPRAQQICDTAKAAGARATLIFEDVGKHDFPTAAYPAVGRWLRGPAMEPAH